MNANNVEEQLGGAGNETACDEAPHENAGDFLKRVGMDGRLWATEMHKRFPQVPEDELLGWCCNMVMAGYDEAMRRERRNYSKLGEILAIQKSSGNWNSNSYMFGMANGLILADAVLRDITPEYMKKPDVWLEYLPKSNVQPTTTEKTNA